jgi:hypothetical protein
MTAIGLQSPDDTWLNTRAPEKIIDLKLDNPREEPFKGKLVLSAPKGFGITVQKGGVLELPAGSHSTVSVAVKADGNPNPGVHLLALKVLADRGAVLERRVPIEWLGDLERRILHGGSRELVGEKLGHLYSSIVPNEHWKRLGVTEGHGDETGAASCLWFHVPEPMRARLRSARLRLHVDLRATRLLRTLPSGRDTEWRVPRRSYGMLKQVKGPPWPDVNKHKYPELPETLEKRSTLKPVVWDENVVEASVPGPLETARKGGDIRMIIEPIGLAGLVYSSTHQDCGNRRAVLIVDLHPEQPGPERE